MTARDMEQDMKGSAKVNAFVQDRDSSNRLYSAMCNRPWRHESGDTWSCSWRYAGGLVAEIRGSGDYMTYYCSGNEGYVHPDVEALLAPMGWLPMTDAEAEAYYASPQS